MSTDRCLLCGHAGLERFNGRERALCRQCSGLERHRGLVRLFDADLRDGGGRHCVEAGPASAWVYGGYLRERGWTYESLDQSVRGHPRDPRAIGFIDRELDLTDLHGVGDASVDLVIAQHVIEEIPDHGRALDEIARILGPGGIALLEIPYDPTVERSRVQAADGFGNVWRFGRDLEDLVRERIGPMEPVRFREETFAGTIFRAVRAAPVPRTDPWARLWAHAGPAPRQRALYLGAACAATAVRLVAEGVADDVVALLDDDVAAGQASAALPRALTDRVQFRDGVREPWRLRGTFDLVVVEDAIRRGEAEARAGELAALLHEDGLLLVTDRSADAAPALTRHLAAVEVRRDGERVEGVYRPLRR